MQSVHYEDDTRGGGHESPVDGLPSSGPEYMRSPGPEIPLEKAIDTEGHEVYVETYPSPHVGQPIRQATKADLPQQAYPDVGALAEPESFEIAELLMESGVSGRFRNRYLRLKRLRHLMPWKNNRALLKDIDKLPHGPDWEVEPFKLDGNRGTEVVEFWKRNPLTVILGMLRDQTRRQHIQLVPQRHYTSQSRKHRRRSELWTGDWLWRTQDLIDDEWATIISCIISSDETVLTNFAGDKKAHPVYFTIGNLPKRLRRRISKRTTVLIGYLPVPKLDCETNKEEKRKMKRDLFHQCMESLLAPLADACNNGGVEAVCADGGVRRIYPVLAAYVADFPEQCKVACVKQTHCPLCTCYPAVRGDPGDSALRDRDDVLQTMMEHDQEGSARFGRLGLLPIKPFWATHPFIDIGSFITPDLLHQVHKGVMKDHLIKWVTTILGKPVMDERYTSMPEYHGMRHFKHGITSVSQWTGRELKEMIKVLLAVMADADERVVRAARALMDFMYLSHSASLTDSDLDAMDDALRTFHNHKDVFEELGTVATDKGFHGIPKIHMISHYMHLIRELGSPDGYNTETSERLHIDFAKMGYRASNKVNAVKQMALYIQRLEAIAMHATHLAETRRAARRSRAKSTDPANLSNTSNRGNHAVNADDLDFELDVGEDDDEDDEEWDTWFDEDEEEDLEELVDAGVKVRPMVSMAGRGDRTQRLGGQWEVLTERQPRQNGAAHNQFCHPIPNPVLAKTATTTESAAYITQIHEAPQFVPSLRSFLAKEAPRYRNTQFDDDQRFKIWSRARLFHSPPPFQPSEGPHADVVRAQPAKVDQFNRVSRPCRFDTVLILAYPDRVGIHRYRPGRVHVLFELPPKIHDAYPRPLAYVELFNRPSAQPIGDVGLYTTTRSLIDGRRATMVIPVSSIRMTCHLAPKYIGQEVEEHLTYRTNTLKLYKTFFINIFATYFFYELMRHWDQNGMPRQGDDDTMSV